MSQFGDGTVVGGRYRVIKKIGAGGVCTVYSAHDGELGKNVAIKLLKSELTSHETLRARFEREAKLLAELSGPSIVLVTDYGSHDNRPYLVMELLEGMTLHQRLAKSPLPEPLIIQVMQDLLTGLGTIHDAGVMHRDLKPGNLFLQNEGPLKILDFGFARRIDDPVDPLQRKEVKLTVAGTAFGTPSYMSPEQATVGEMDARTDLYAAGVVLFELLAGKPPFRGEPPAILKQHITEPVPQLEAAAKGLQVAPQLQVLIATAMAKDKQHRYTDAGAMLEALNALPRPCVLGEADRAAKARPADDEDRATRVFVPDRSVPPPPPSMLAEGASPPPKAQSTGKSEPPKPPKATASRRPQAPKPPKAAATKSTTPKPPPPPKAAASRAPAAPPDARVSAPPPPPKAAASGAAKRPARAKKGDAKAKKASHAPPPQPPTAASTSPNAKTLLASAPASPPQAAAAAAASFVEGDLDDARLLATLETQLQNKPAKARAARLHYELGLLHGQRLGDHAVAAKHFGDATKLDPNHLPSIRGARRALIAAGREKQALPLFDAELKLHAQPGARARLHFEHGRLIEATRGKVSDALDSYRAGLDLDSSDIDLLRAVARLEHAAKDWEALDATLGRLAALAEGEHPYRAALIARRARIADNLTSDPARAAELYLSALILDPDLPGAIEALKRTGRSRRQWQMWMQSLEQEAARSNDGSVIAAAHATIATIQATQLNNPEDAIAALESAVDQVSDDRTLLTRLANLQRDNERYADEAGTLQRIASLTDDAHQRVALHHRIATIFDAQLRDASQAQHHYSAALALDGNHRPSLRSLDVLHRRNNNWRGLLELYELELAASDAPEHCANLHVQLAGLLEGKLSEPETAISHLKTALSLCPHHDSARRELDRILPDMGRFDDLVQIYEQLVDHAPNGPHAINYLFRIGGLREDRLDDAPGAAHAYERILAIEPARLGALHALQRAAGRAGSHALLLRAIDMELATLSRTPRWAALQLRAAEVVADALDDAPAAVERVREVVEALPETVGALTALGRLYARLRRWDQLQQVHASELKLARTVAEQTSLLYRMGCVAETDLGKPRDAMNYHGRALKLDPTYLPSHDALVNLQRQAGAWKGLSATLETRAGAVSDARLRAYLWFEIGEITEDRLSDPVGALRAHEHALQAVASFRPSTDARMRLLCDQKRYPELSEALLHEAQHAHDGAIALDATMRAAAVQAELLDDPATAATTYEAALERAPGHMTALIALEVLYTQLGDGEGLARTYQAQVAGLDGAQPQVAILRDIARLAGDGPHARATYAQLVALDPADAEALETLASAADQSHDDEAYVRHHAALAVAAPDPGIAAEHHLAAALRMETSAPPQALAAYRTALALDSASMSAARGITRCARALGDPAAISQAAGFEANLTGDKQVAVALYLEAASLRRAAGAAQEAGTDIQNALELDPSHVQAAQQLTTTLIGLGEIPRLCDLLGRAAQDGTRGADLHTEVARLRAEQMDDIPEAIASLERALECQAHHPAALGLMPAFLEETGQWKRAAEAHDALIEHRRGAEQQLLSHLAIARISLQRLDDVKRAEQHLGKVLAKQPQHAEALRLKARMLSDQGKHDEALDVAQTLLDSAETPADRVALLLEIARAQSRIGRPTDAVHALCEAVTIEGEGGEAGNAYRAVIGEHATWEDYVVALEGHLASQQDPALGAVTVLAIAKAQAEGMRAPKRAVATLEHGARDYPDAGAIWLAYGSLLTLVGRHDDAIEVYRRQISRTPHDPSLWRGLGEAHNAAGRGQEAVSAALPLLLLDAASNEQLLSLRGRKPQPNMDAGTMNDATIAAIDTGEALRSPLAPLTRAMATVLGKIHPGDLKRYGVTRRDRLSAESEESVRQHADQMARLLGMGEFELYLHDLDESDVHIELLDAPALMVPRGLCGQNSSALLFSLSRQMFTIAQGLAALEVIETPELALLLGGAIRRQLPDFTDPLATDDALDEASRIVGKALPWLGRGPLDEATAKFDSTPIDIAAWIDQARRCAGRAALLVSDDLLGGVEQLRTASDWSPMADPQALDLLHFWASDAAVSHRAQA